MITHSHQTLIESGNGSLHSSCCLSEEGYGVLCLNTGEPGEIGRELPTPEDYDPAKSEILWIFKNIESLTVMIENMQRVRHLMRQFENGEITKDKPKSKVREYTKDGNFKEYEIKED